MCYVSGAIAARYLVLQAAPAVLCYVSGAPLPLLSPLSPIAQTHLVNLLARIPENTPLFSPVATSFAGLVPPDVAAAANGDDGMLSDFLTAAAAAQDEPNAGNDLSASLASFDTQGVNTILDGVNSTGATLRTFQSTGDGLLGAVTVLAPPADPAAPASPPAQPPDLGTSSNGDPTGGAGGGDSGGDLCNDFGFGCNGCLEGDEPGCFTR